LLGAGASVWLVPIVASTAKRSEPERKVVNYSKAEADVKFGRYNEAEQEIIEQLENDARDFDGWMKLATLYAKNFGDLTSADQTVRDLCGQPDLSVAQVAYALDTLATWHLDIGNNPAAARSALAELCKRIPGTHSAKMAELRLKQLPRDSEELIERRKPMRIRLPALREEARLRPTGFGVEEQDTRPQVDEAEIKEAARLANQCVDLLKAEPNNVGAREKLATLFAEKLGKVQPGIDQLRLLMDVDGVGDGKKAEWLSLIAAWQLNLLHDPAAAASTCKRILRDYPQTAQAFAAQRRLNLMEMEQRFSNVKGV
jgi:hypothetical protein